MLTVQELKLALPKGLQGNATQELADKIDAIAGDPEVAREVRDNFITYAKVLQEGKYKTDDYLNAITYCTFKLMGYNNKESYIKTFPDRYQALVAKGSDERTISAYVAMYHKNQLVNKILEQSFIPMWLLNQEAVQKAINTQLDLMANADSELVRTQAANSILTHLKQPEVKKVELDVKVKGSGGLDELRSTMAELAATQANLIAQGAGAKTITRMPITVIDADVVDVEPTPVPPTRVAAPLPPQPTTIAGLRGAMQGTLPAYPDVLDVTPKGTFELPVEDPEPEEIESAGPISLFGNPAPKTVLEIKSPAINYARCCENAIEDCMCDDTDHIYLPTKQDTPQLKRVSLFDDPAGMP